MTTNDTHPATWKTSKGRPVTWFVDQQREQGHWQEQIITPELTGLSRPITVFRTQKASDYISYVRQWQKSLCAKKHMQYESR